MFLGLVFNVRILKAKKLKVTSREVTFNVIWGLIKSLIVVVVQRRR